MSKKLTIQEFITRCNITHNNKYDYSKVNYLGWNSTICIICPIHGDFYQKAFLHTHKNGCQECAKTKVGNTHSYTQEDFVNKCKAIHGDKYDYSKSIYTKSKNKVIIICPIHGEYNSLAQTHLRGSGCRKCARKQIGELNSSTKEHFIKRAIEKHGDKYDYSSVNFINTFTPVDITCPEHGIFTQLPRQHTYGNACPQCYKRGCSKSKWLNLASKNENATLYIVKMFNKHESFIKIGITTYNTIKRFISKQTPYRYEILKEIEDVPENIWNKEKELHKKFKEFKYKPLLSFSGRTECFKLEILNSLSNSLYRTISK